MESQKKIHPLSSSSLYPFITCFFFSLLHLKSHFPFCITSMMGITIICQFMDSSISHSFPLTFLYCFNPITLEREEKKEREKKTSPNKVRGLNGMIWFVYFLLMKGVQFLKESFDCLFVSLFCGKSLIFYHIAQSFTVLGAK